MGGAFSESLSKPLPKTWLHPLLTQTTYFSHTGRKQPGRDTSQQTPNYCLGFSIAETEEERQLPDLPFSLLRVPSTVPNPCSQRPPSPVQSSPGKSPVTVPLAVI